MLKVVHSEERNTRRTYGTYGKEEERFYRSKTGAEHCKNTLHGYRWLAARVALGWLGPCWVGSFIEAFAARRK